jgi:tetratricopeptide (TPR) repeat protein
MVTVSLCVIARDEEPHIEGCLVSARDQVDEMIVVDTGSHDSTAALARRLGARVLHYQWRDDFAGARNYSLEQARGDWLLCLDADERLRGTGDLGAEVRQAPDSQLALALPLRPHPAWTRYRAYRLFRSRRAIAFSGRVHETIRPALARLAGLPGPWALLPADLVGDSTTSWIEHLELDEQIRKQKQLRNLPLLAAELAAGPLRPLVRNDLAALYHQQGQRQRALALIDDGIGMLRACSYRVSPLAACLYLRKAELVREEPGDDGPEAPLREGIERFPATLQLSLQLGEHYLLQRQLAQAVQHLSAAVGLIRHDSYDRDLPMPRSYIERRPFAGLANARWMLGDRQAAEMLYTELVQRHPGDLALRATLAVITYLRDRR